MLERTRQLGLLLPILIAPLPAAAVTITTGTDTFLQEAAPDDANGTEVRWEYDGADPQSSTNDNHGLIQLDLGLDSPDPDGTLRDRILASPGFTATLVVEVVNPGDDGDLHRLSQAFDDNTTWNSFGGGVITSGAGQNAQTVSNASITGTEGNGAVRVDVTADILAWANGEIDFGWAFLPTGDNGAEMVSFEGGSGSPQLILERQSDFVTAGTSGSTWRYFDQIVFPSIFYPTDAEGDQWYEADFDDSSWASGEGSFGYGTITGGAVNETVASGEITYLFRTTFDLTVLPDELMAEILRDDGIVVYLNGNEVLRDNLPGGAIDAATLASGTISGINEGVFSLFTLDPADLVIGTNTLAVEVHNRSASSSDIGFDMRLFGAGDLVVLSMPEPSTGLLVAMGLIGIGVLRRRRCSRR